MSTAFKKYLRTELESCIISKTICQYEHIFMNTNTDKSVMLLKPTLIYGLYKSSSWT